MLREEGEHFGEINTPPMGLALNFLVAKVVAELTNVIRCLSCHLNRHNFVLAAVIEERRNVKQVSQPVKGSRST
ncbi:hypothetical protein HRbin17_02471 [bacterium HR17]|uniref:Uncharacterized protein n=1 Tax=Candidatus Fervidibacter japonicus TaxID=2035412 RepID=A0A2H5XFI4_9BACT|nr:hypothetical protein HRbin17_02471 [bacterium HR17]